MVVPGETCPTGGSSVAGVAFYDGGNYPGYDGALFFADYSRDCIWAMRAGSGRAPRSRAPAHLRRRSGEPGRPADRPGRRPLLRRLRRRHGPADPLLQRQPAARRGRNGEPDGRRDAAHRQFNGSGSSDPDAGDTSRYAWDLDGDGALRRLDDRRTPTRRTPPPARYVARLRVTDAAGASARVADDHGRQHRPVGRRSRPVGGDDLARRRGHLLLGLRDRSRAGHAARVARSAGSSSCTTARRTATAHDPVVLGRRERLVHGAGP